MRSVSELFQSALHHHQNGNLAEAEAAYRQVLQAEPRHADVHHMLGILAHQRGDRAAALSHIQRAIELAPGNAAYHFTLGSVLQSAGDLAKAADNCRQALRLNPNLLQAYVTLGTILESQGKAFEGLECYRQALRQDPNHAAALYNLGTALLNDWQLEEAADCLARAAQIQPNHAKIQINLGNALKELGRLPEAADCFRRALQVTPDSIEALNNLGNALVGQGLLEAGDSYYRQALALDPNGAMTRWNQALLRLTRGDFTDVWPDFELRWDLPNWPPAKYHGPHWDGTPLEGKTILVYYEQGLGDVIQFIRYLPLVKQRGGTVLFACQPALRELFADIAGVDRLLDPTEPTPQYDVRIPLLSLPGIFGTVLDTIPAAIPYLRADPRRVEFWRHELGRLSGSVAVGSPLNVGIAWQGNPRTGGDRLRSLPLEHFEPLARVPGVRLFSLQKRPGAEQIAALKGRFPVIDLGPRLESLCDTAAVMMNLDLVISSDTAVAHLAGALGVRTWTVLQLVPDWRWFLDRADCPWYPTTRLFRQTSFRAWGPVFERIADEIRTLRPLLKPDSAEALNNLGTVLGGQEHFADAAEYFRQALAINANYADAHYNLGMARAGLQDFAGAADCYERAFALDPQHPSAQWNLALVRLFQGDLQKGWPGYEACRTRRVAGSRVFEKPRWDGFPLNGKTILLYAEYGLGDTILFIRYALLVQARAAGESCSNASQRSLAFSRRGCPVSIKSSLVVSRCPLSTCRCR